MVGDHTGLPPLTKAEPPHMWEYWRDKKGIEAALTDYFPRTLAIQPKLQAALTQLQSAEVLIDKIMADLTPEQRF
jgi:hypothetical protein